MQTKYGWLTDALKWHCDEVKTEHRGSELHLVLRWGNHVESRCLERAGFSLNATIEAGERSQRTVIAGFAAPSKPLSKDMPESAVAAH